MCGIVGVIGPDKCVQQHDVEAMRDSIAHRGPDDQGFWQTSSGGYSVGLGHRRLSIIDLTSDGAQPMHAGNGLVSIVFNGEIYNYLELREELIARGHSFNTESDTEVLLSAYLQWGNAFLSKLNGMFAFILFDDRTKTILLARDRLGEKPLYFAHTRNGALLVASEMKAIQAHRDFSTHLNDDVFQKFMFGGVHKEVRPTLVSGISRVLAAEAIEFGLKSSGTPETWKKWKYWAPNYTVSSRFSNLEQAAEALHDHLKRSVKMRMRSDAEIGVYLSGGIDSSAIAALMEQQGRTDNLKSYSIRFDDDETISEGRYIDYMAKRLSFEPRQATPDVSSMIDHWEGLHACLEEPSLSGSILNEYLLAKLASENGTKVILSGQGADELLAGYQYYFQLHQLDLLYAGDDKRLERETTLLHRRLEQSASRYKNVARRFSDKPGLPIDTLQNRRKREPLPNAIHDYFDVPNIRSQGYLRKQLGVGLLYDQLPPNLHISDRCGMAFGVETRFPFLDYELVDWATRLPNDVLISDGWLKMVLRKAMQSVVPAGISWRVDKVGFAAPQDSWIADAPENWVRSLLFEGPIADQEQYDKKGLEFAFKNRANDLTGAHSWTMWKWMSANQWLMNMQAA